MYESHPSDLRGPTTAASLKRVRPVPELDDLLRERFLHAAIDPHGLRPAWGDQMKAEFPGAPYISDTAEQLAAAATGDDRNAQVARRALQLLQEIAWATRPRPSGGGGP